MNSSTSNWDTVRPGDVAIVERGSTIVSGRITEVGPRYVVVEHLNESLSMLQGWRLTYVLTPQEVDGAVEPTPASTT